MSDLTKDAAHRGGNRAVTSSPDGSLLGACEVFFRLNKIWIDANPEGNAPQSRNWSAEERRRVATERDEALRTLRNFRATRIPEVIEKYKVLVELVQWKPIEDGRVVALALELIEEYNFIFLRKHLDGPSISPFGKLGDDTYKGSVGKKLWKFNLQNILGIFHL